MIPWNCKKRTRLSAPSPARTTITAVAAFLGAGGVLAAPCTDVTGQMWGNADRNASVHTLVTNESASKVFEVSISRNGKEKNRKIINSRDPSTSYLMKSSRNSTSMDVTVEILRRDVGGFLTASCAYNVSFDSGTATSDWTLPQGQSGICPDLEALCSDCALSCSHSYNSNKGRWNTRLTISD